MAQRIKHPEVITKLLEERGISQRRAAAEMGLSQMSKLNLSLHGQRDMSLSEIIALAKVLGVEWCKLLPAFGVADPTASDLPPQAWDRPAEQTITLTISQLKELLK